MSSVYVDRSFCQKFGNCVAVAPKIFWFRDEDGELEYREELEEGELPLAQDAGGACPMAAIEVRE